jgi:hypothetical protein
MLPSISDRSMERDPIEFEKLLSVTLMLPWGADG